MGSRALTIASVALACTGCRGGGPEGASYEVEFRATATSEPNAAEQSIAIDPNNPDNLIAAIIDEYGPGFYPTNRYAWSLEADGGDGGRNWDDAVVPYDSNTLRLTTGDGLTWEGSADPVVAIDRTGHAYLGQVYFDGGGSSVAIYVSATTLPSAGGAFAFDAAGTRPVAPGETTEDKPWVAADNTGSAYDGNVYVAWSHYETSPTRTATVGFSRSLDHGATWEAWREVTPPVTAAKDDGLSGTQVAIGPQGEVYLVYEVVESAAPRSEHFLVRSTDGGATFGDPVAITPPFDDVGFGATYRLYSYPSCAVSPTSGEISCVYGDQQGDHARVEFITSTDGGATFSEPATLDPADGHQFMPALAVDETGGLHATWFDTRNNPSDTSRYDIYAARSDDGGTTWLSSTRVTEAPADAGDTWFIGDYTSIAAAGGKAHPVWTSGGLNGGRLETAALTW